MNTCYQNHVVSLRTLLVSVTLLSARPQTGRVPPPRADRPAPRKKGFAMNQAYYALVTLQAFFSDRLDDRKDRGATAVEYGLMVGLIAIAIIGAVIIFRQQLEGIFTEAGTALDTKQAPAV